MNFVNISGRMARDPEKRDTPTGTSITAFVVAVPRSYAPKGQERQTDFLYCKAFNHTGDFILAHFKKGSAIEVSGSLEVRKYVDSEGKNRSSTEIVVSSVGFPPTAPKEEKAASEIPF